MKRTFALAAAMTDLELLASYGPMTPELRKLLMCADYFQSLEGGTQFRQALKQPVIAATDPWADIEYQSLYLTDTNPEDRIILQEPPVKDPMVGVMVLKAARLRGESGMVYCGTPEQLKEFASKLGSFEQVAEEEDMDEKLFLESLVDAAEQMELKVIYWRLSPEHGGDEDGDE